MARSKSTPGSKTSRLNKEQTGAGNPANPDLKAVAETAPAAVSPEVKRDKVPSSTPEPKVASEAKPAPEPKGTPDARALSESRKFEVRKPDSRKNVVPINLDDEIRRRAYELYQQRGTGAVRHRLGANSPCVRCV